MENKYHITVNKVNFVDGGFIIDWSDLDWGWGELTVIYDYQMGRFTIDSEYMSEDFVKACLVAFAEYMINNFDMVY